MSFHDVRFPTDISFGATGGPERRTEIVTLTSGHEERNTPWAHARRRYDAGLGLRSLDALAEVLAFFEARRGQLYGFRWKDWTDFRSAPPSRPMGPEDQLIGLGDGETAVWGLTKTYRSGEASYTRPIAKPVAGTVQVAVAGNPLREGVHFTLDASRGLVTFDAAPADGERITAGFEFDVPVRFDTDRIETSLATFEAGEVPSIPVIEVRT